MIFLLLEKYVKLELLKKVCEKIIKVCWFYKIKSQPIWKGINEMIINFLKEKQNNSTLLDIFLLKIHNIEILNNGTVMDTINDH